MARHTLVLATHNRGKRLELQALLDAGQSQLALLAPAGLGLTEPNEPFGTFVENALHKARQAAAGTGLPALADDSGLSVDALGGAPGVWSSTYAGAVQALPDEPREALRQRQDAANTARLLSDLASAQAADATLDRRARFLCTLVAVRSAQDPEPLVAVGRWEGRIADHASGAGGFGYDPVFALAGTDTTVAALASAHKNSHSHRALAAALLRPMLAQVWGWELGA